MSEKKPNGEKGPDPRPLSWEFIQQKLREKGIDLDELCCDRPPGSAVKVVCIAPGLDESYEEMGKSPRGATVMIRTDEETSQTLDDWVESGYFKSRSEAAALFLREGLKMRADELAKLKGALEEVKAAKDKLHEKADAIFGRKRSGA
jgi:Arc/MetJ-type ribon-helix-helix transcriptional regulator